MCAVAEEPRPIGELCGKCVLWLAIGELCGKYVLIVWGMCVSRLGLSAQCEPCEGNCMSFAVVA